MKTSEYLRAAFQKIDSEEKWTQGVFAKKADGRSCPSSSADAVCFCSVGALNVINVQEEYHSVRRNAVGYLDRVAADIAADITRKAGPVTDCIVAFNDTRSYTEVASVWARAIASAEAAGD